VSFSYVDPTAHQRDAVRFLVGDTDETEVQLQDEEINWLIATWGDTRDPYFLAYRAADAIASKYAREIDINADAESLGANVLMEKYKALGASLLAQSRELLGDNVFIYVGGVDVTEQLDPTVSAPAFGTRMHDNREAGRQDYGDSGDIPDSWESGQWGEFVP
jgi:hypothetical protein